MKEEKTNGRKRFDANTGTMVESNDDDDRDAQQRRERRRNRGSGERAEWGNADSAKVLAAISACTRHGYAIRFGYTKDGGAYAIGIIGDGEPFTEFVRPTEDINLYLDGVILDYGK